MGGSVRRARAWKITRRTLPWLALVAVFAVLSLGGCIESRVFYWPSRAHFDDPPGVENVRFQTSDGKELHAWFLRAEGVEDGPAPAVVHAHGNAGSVADHLAFSEFLPEAGVSVLLFDYRSYGRSDRGRLHRRALYRDTEAALDYLLSRDDVDSSRVGAYGVSLGGAMAIRLASEREEVRAIATVGAFAGWKKIASDHGGLLGRVLIPSGMDPVDGASALGERPFLIVHGSSDEIIPTRHAALLKEAAREGGTPVEVLKVAGGMHNDVLFVDPTVPDQIAVFFREALDAGTGD